MVADTHYIPYPARHVDADVVANHVDLEMPGSRPRFQNYTIVAGQGVLAKGSVLGMITSTRKLKLAASAAGDGSQTPIAVLGSPVDTTADVTFDVMVTDACLNPAALVLGAGTTQNAAVDALVARGFTFRTPAFSPV